MDNVFEFKGATVEAAIQNGLNELKLNKEDVEIEILNNGGFITKAQVRLTVKPEQPQEIAEEKLTPMQEDEEFDSASKKERPLDAGELELAMENVTAFIETLLLKMDIGCQAEVGCKNDEIFINVVGKRASLVIGHRGEVLDSIQYLSLLVANRGLKGFVRVHADAESYRQRRIDTLTSLAMRLARGVSKSGRPAELEPMNPFERRVIHAALTNDRYVTTESVGEGRNRRVIIKPIAQGSRNSGYSDRGSNYQNRNSDKATSDRSSGFGERSASYDNSFKKKGPAKTKSFGYNNKKF